jgi:Mn-containing catalase
MSLILFERREGDLILRLDKLLIEWPKREHPDAHAAAAVQELLGGKFGEMSTLNHCM